MGETVGRSAPTKRKGRTVCNLCRDGWLRRHQGESAVPPRWPTRWSFSSRYFWFNYASLLCGREVRAVSLFLCYLDPKGRGEESGQGG
jgi:hypothetical protein